MKNKFSWFLAVLLFASGVLFTGCEASSNKAPETSYSYEELEDVKRQIDLLKVDNGDDIAVNIKATWIDIENNAVVVELRVVDKGYIRVFKELICDSEAVVFAHHTSSGIVIED